MRWHWPPMTTGARYAVIALLIYFTVGLGGGYVLALSAIHRAEANAASVTQLCHTGNELRAQQVGLWAYIIHISRPPPHETAAQRAQRNRITRVFIAHLHKVFAPRNCAHPSRTEPTP